jgi:hypothetical protein
VVVPELRLAKPSDNAGHVTLDPKLLNPDSIPLVVKSEPPLGTPYTMSSDTLNITLSFQAANTDTIQDVYLALVLRAENSDKLTTASSTSPGISALILATLNPTGTIPIDLEIKDFTLPLFHDSWSPLKLNPTLANNSDIMIRPEGKFEIKSPTDKAVYSSPLYPNLLLGNSTRTLYLDPQNSNLAPKPLIWSPKWSNIGPYRFHLTINTLGGTKITDVEKIVWILPLRLFFTALAILIILLTLITKHSRFKRV